MQSVKIISQSLTFLAVFLPALSYAAPELIVTWKTSSYVPAGYTGKALPTAGTAIDVSAILVDGNTVVSLSPYDINWYAGEDRFAGGKGTASARITAPITGQDSMELRINVTKYNNQPLDAFITIPVVRPEMFVLQKPGTETQNLSIIPYFWNILTLRDLAVTWEDNGSTITARAVNKKNELEFAQMTIPKE